MSRARAEILRAVSTTGRSASDLKERLRFRQRSIPARNILIYLGMRVRLHLFRGPAHAARFSKAG
jgi:hypothetical protein